MSAFRWCGRQELNLHVVKHQSLNLARLPIPPRPQIFSFMDKGSRARVTLAVPEIHLSRYRSANFDRCANAHSLYLALRALVLVAANSATPA